MEASRSSVCIKKISDYNTVAVAKAVSDIMDALGYTGNCFEGKKVVVKPNLVRKMDPAGGGTTHPSFVFAAASAAKERGAADVLIAESPSGPYNEGALHGSYRVCGVADAAAEAGASLNFDCNSEWLELAGGKRVKRFHIIRPIADADVIINLSKLKTHGLTTLSAAVKNLFGTVPGTEKLEMHARFPEVGDFCGMIVDLCRLHYERTDMINIVDAVVAMEGNGPTNGKPRRLGFVVAGRNPFAVDYVCEKCVSFDGKTPTVAISESEGLFSRDTVTLVGEPIENVRINDFVMPDSRKGLVRFLANARIMRLFEPRPTVNGSKCVCCGECVRSCPKKTIALDMKKHRAVINAENCIKCFCCQELCPHDAVKIKRSLIVTNLR